MDRRGHDYIAQGAVAPAPAFYWRTTRDGRTFEVRTTSLADGSLVRTFADVSDYVRVENELRESEARFRSLSDLSSDWYWEHDADGRFNQLAGDLSVNGIPLSSVMGRTSIEVKMNSSAPSIRSSTEKAKGSAWRCSLPSATAWIRRCGR